MRGFEEERQQSDSILNRIQVNLNKYAFGQGDVWLTPSGVRFQTFIIAFREWILPLFWKSKILLTIAIERWIKKFTDFGDVLHRVVPISLDMRSGINFPENVGRVAGCLD